MSCASVMRVSLQIQYRPGSPGGRSSSGGESRATGQDSAESGLDDGGAATSAFRISAAGLRVGHFDLGAEAEDVAALAGSQNMKPGERCAGLAAMWRAGSVQAMRRRHKLAWAGHVRVHEDADGGAGVDGFQEAAAEVVFRDDEVAVEATDAVDVASRRRLSSLRRSCHG